MSFSPVSMPTMNYGIHLHTPKPPKPELKTMKTKEVFKGFTEFTKGAATVTFSPEYSMFIQGIKMMNGPSGGFLGGIDQGIGLLSVMASPVWGVLRLGLGVPATLIGALGTSATGVSMGVEKGIHTIEECFTSSEETVDRKHLTEAFVERLQKILSDFPYTQGYELRKNPTHLICLGVISVAFLSRGLEKGLLIGQEVLMSEDLKNSSKTVKKYFELTQEIKLAIRDLPLDQNDFSQAWNELIAMLENSENETTSSLSNEKETLNLMMKHVAAFSTLAIQDSNFVKAWKAAYPEFDPSVI